MAYLAKRKELIDSNYNAESAGIKNELASLIKAIMPLIPKGEEEMLYQETFDEKEGDNHTSYHRLELYSLSRDGLLGLTERKHGASKPVCDMKIVDVDEFLSKNDNSVVFKGICQNVQTLLDKYRMDAKASMPSPYEAEIRQTAVNEV